MSRTAYILVGSVAAIMMGAIAAAAVAGRPSSALNAGLTSVAEYSASPLVAGQAALPQSDRSGSTSIAMIDLAPDVASGSSAPSGDSAPPAVAAPMTKAQIEAAVQAAIAASDPSTSAATLHATIQSILDQSGASADVKAAALADLAASNAGGAAYAAITSGFDLSGLKKPDAFADSGAQNQDDPNYNPLANPQSTGLTGGNTGSFGSNGLPSVNPSPVVSSNGTSTSEGQPVLR